MDEATLASVIQSLWTCINFDEEIARIRLKCAKKRIARTAVDFFFRTCCVFCRTEWFFMWLWAKFRRFSCSFGRTNVRKAWRRWACGEKGLISIKPKDLVKLGLLQKASLNLAFGLAGIYIYAWRVNLSEGNFPMQRPGWTDLPWRQIHLKGHGSWSSNLWAGGARTSILIDEVRFIRCSVLTMICRHKLVSFN